MRIILGISPLLLLTISGCATKHVRVPIFELSGASETIRPQRPPTLLPFDTVRSSSYRTRSIAQANTRPGPENIVISLNGQQVIIPVNKPNKPTLFLPEIIPPGERASGVLTVEAQRARQPQQAAPQAIRVTADAEKIRNPSFNARRPRVVARPPYRTLGREELLRLVELAPKFQNGTTNLADPIERWIDNAATILRANPKVALRITGFAMSTEPGGRALAQRRAETVSDALRLRGVGSGRIETEGRLVLVTHVAPGDMGAVSLASRRARIRVVAGQIEEDPFQRSRIPALGQ